LIKQGRRYVSFEALPEEGRLDAAQANIEFEMLMDSLDEKSRTALVLHYSEGFSVKEIGEALGISETAVKQRLKRGRDKVRGTYRDTYKMEVLI
jgi:RNA polymerase sigma-70 factor (ECF subfamily)